MFRKALAVAGQFTFPVVISQRTVAGECSSGIGSFVVINKDGWIVTAGHILSQIDRMLTGAAQVRTHVAENARIRADASLSNRDRSAALNALGRLNPKAIEQVSAWWAFAGVAVKDVHVIDDVDLGVARLEPFDASLVKGCAVFKDPAAGIDQGVSLCKLGFPFHSITPIWDAAAGTFSFPPGAIPLPSFPIEGILTRTVMVPSTAPAQAFPLTWIETSSPGLMGQSGGPTFDDQGVVWAIQSQTAHLHLGFDPPVPGGKSGEKEHQFLNVGRGVSTATILGFLDSLGVKYDVSAY
jgi:hypothetical protein